MNINLNITKNSSINRLLKLLSSEKHSVGLIGYGRSLKLEIESETGNKITEPLKFIILTGRNVYEEKNFEFEDYSIEIQYQPLSYCQHKIVKERNAKWVFIFKDCVIYGDEKAGDYFEKIEDKNSGVCEYLKSLAKEIYADGPYPLKKAEIERIRYRLFIESERLKENVKNNHNNAQFLMGEGFHRLIETYFRLERIWAQSTSSSYVLYELKKHNYNLYEYGINFLNEQNIRHKFYYYYKITEEILKPFGGFSEDFKSGKRRGYTKNYSILLHPVYFLIQSVESSILQEDYKYYRLYSLIKLLKFLKPYYFYFIEVTAYGLLAAGLAMIPTYFTKLIFDTVIPAKNYGLLKILLITGGIAAGFKALLDLLQNYYSAYMQSLIDYDVKFRFYKKIFDLPFSYFTNKKTGEVIFKFSDLSAAIGILSNLIIQMLEYILYFFLFPVIIIIIDYKLALLSAIVIPFNAYCYYKLSDYIRKYVKSITARQEEYSAKSYESISGVRAIQGYDIKDRVIKKLKYLYLNIRKNSMIITAITNGFEFIIAIAAIISGMIFTWYAVSRILIGDLTIGELIM
ncbi:ABC transporter ATP-binding protein, partial [Candidatus Dependentiae bacterium]|nr:ABC transporter ATP-binding protein [Candidatus Dependentiae bacterium]